MPGATRTILRGWVDRLTGRLKPGPCPFSIAAVLDSPLRKYVAGPDRILSRCDVRAGDRILEIGAGTGYYSLQLALRAGSGGRVICLDLQQEMLLATRDRLRQVPGCRADLVLADAAALPIRSHSVDRVVLIGVLGEFSDPDVVLSSIRRVLRTTGRLFVSEQLPDPDFVTRGKLRRELTRHGFIEESTRGRAFYTSMWS